MILWPTKKLKLKAVFLKKNWFLRGIQSKGSIHKYHFSLFKGDLHIHDPVIEIFVQNRIEVLFKNWGSALNFSHSFNFNNKEMIQFEFTWADILSALVG